MKTKKFLMLLAAVLLSCASAIAQNSPLKGDVNGDGKVDVADIVAILEIMKNGAKELQSIEWVNTTASSTYGQPINLPKIKLINSDNSTSQINGNASGVTYSTTLTSSTEAGTYLITATYQGKTTTNTLNYTIIPATTYYWYVGTTQPTAVDNPSAWRTSNSDAGFTIQPNVSSSDKIWVAYPNSWTLEITDADGYGVGNDYLSASIKNSINGYLVNRFTADSNTSAWTFKFTK